MAEDASQMVAIDGCPIGCAKAIQEEAVRQACSQGQPKRSPKCCCG